MAGEQVGIGSRVIIEMVDASGDAEQMILTLVPDHAADYDAGLIGVSTPLAKAIRGKHAGAVVVYDVGDMVEIRIVDVSQGTAQLDDDRAARRQASYDEALRKAERTNAEMFASSYGSKWGGYELDEET